ncbi:Uncharacterised protein [Shigella sonnei]|nr:Uncharacterised protein [Shigella sonnei]CSQ01489.1 Uncharacterised protein [Shigella sonnei]CST36826.1 Uncharacterised protein [Shigella sonnei]
MVKAVCAFKEHLAAFQQRHYPFHAGKQRKLPIRRDGCNAGTPVKITFCRWESANFARFTGSISPQIHRHFTHIKVFHTRSRPVLFIVIVQVTVDGYRQLG